MGERRSYRLAVAIAVVTSLVTVWTTVVRDDGNGLGFFLVILTVAVGAFAAWFRPAGMARTMLGVAVMQLLVGVAIATAPFIEATPGASFRALAISGIFSSLWLISAAFFRAAARLRDKPPS
jgi:hypothetical protein